MGKKKQEKPIEKPDMQELIDDIQRLQADFDNYRKRHERDIVQFRQLATEALIKDLLPILDSLGLVLDHAASDPQGLVEGVKLTRGQLLSLLESRGLKPVTAEGKFDPARHEAITTVEDANKENGMIVATLQSGYALGEKLLRPARVSVIKNMEGKHETA